MLDDSRCHRARLRYPEMAPGTKKLKPRLWTAGWTFAPALSARQVVRHQQCAGRLLQVWCRCQGRASGMNLTSPDTTCRGASSPMSTSSTYKLQEEEA